MVQWAVIISIIISLVAGIYGVILLNELRKKHRLEFLNSFFYYHLLLIIFGVYGILGNIIVQQILLKYELESSLVETIAHFFPFLGVPFVLVAWYMFLKFSAEIINKKVPQYVAVSFFFITLLAFLIYGWFIQKLPEDNYASLTQKVIVVFYTIELIINTYIFLILLLYSFKLKNRQQKLFLFRFAIILISLAIFKSISMHFSSFNLIIGLYFILFFFAGNLSLILLSKVHLAKHSIEYQENISATDSLIEKFHISKREKQIIEEICKGKTNQQIADELFITLQTVKDHTHNIYKKVNVKNRVQLTQLFSQSLKDSTT